jgi:class 3 adenylate cyclase
VNCAWCAGTMPPDARYCPYCGAASARPATAEERKLVTVVFCDLVGSTPLAEALDPETLRSVTLRYFAAMRKPIEERGGTVEKFIGDAVMAVFGIPTMHEDDAYRAAAATIGMLEALAELNDELDASLGVRLRVRIGVNTGPAVTGTDTSTRQAMVSGDTVNVAARLEQTAGAGEILIGPLTRRALGVAARTEAAGPLRLKGKKAPVTAYRLLGVEADGLDPQLLRRFDVPFVGRVTELDELNRVLDAVAAGPASRRVTVLGEPGIGKTRLVRTWLEGTSRPLAHGTGRCPPYGDHGSLAPLADAVHHLLVGSGGASDPEALAVLRSGLLQDGTPGPSTEATCAALARLLDGMARGRPVVLTLDDCQWASEPLVGMVDSLVAATEGSAVMVVCVARLDLLDRLPDWASGRGSHVLLLPGLSSTDCNAIVASLVEVSTHMASGWTRILEAAGGNPFYLEQLVAAVTESDPDCELPHTLYALLGARIDALEYAERATLDLAAILGREFGPRQVAALAETGPEGRRGGLLARGAEADPVRTALTRLGRRRLVEPAGATPPEGASLRFTNALVWEATYRAMAKRTRAERHERAASVLADWHAATATVASHLDRAYRYRVELGLLDESTDRLRSRAAELYAAAGGNALDRSDLTWAGTLLSRAMELFASDEPGRVTVARRLGEVLIATGDTDGGRSLLRSALDASTDPVETAHARLAMAVVDSSGAGGTAAVVARETLGVFEAAGDDLGQARARIRMAQEHQLHGQHGRAHKLLATSLVHAVRRNAEPELALALGAAGISLWRGPTRVPVAIDRCRLLLASHGGPRPVVRVTLNCPLAVLLALDDQLDDARACLAAARRLADQLDYAEGGVVMPIFAAAVEVLAGRSDHALRLLDRAAAVAGGMTAGGLGNAIAREAARVLLDDARPAEAAARLASVGAGAELLRSDAADLHGLRSRLAAATGATGEALDLAAQAVSAAATTDSPIVQAVAALDQAATLEHLGLLEEAAAAADRARRRFEIKGHRPGTRRAVAFLSRLATALPGRPIL